METAIKARGETAIPGAGEGIFLRFRNSDLKRIEEIYGVEWFNEFTDRAMHGTISFEMLETYLNNGVKKNGQPHKLDEDFIDDMPVDDLTELVLDAVIRSKRGVSAKEYFAEVFGRLAQMAEDGEVPPAQSPDGATSTTSDEGVSGPASE